MQISVELALYFAAAKSTSNSQTPAPEVRTRQKRYLAILEGNDFQNLYTLKMSKMRQFREPSPPFPLFGPSLGATYTCFHLPVP